MNKTINYQEYLKSVRWRKRRMKVIKRDKFECVACEQVGTEIKGITINNLNAHHETYRNLSSKNPQKEIDDCITLCQMCHEGIHNTTNYLKEHDTRRTKK